MLGLCFCYRFGYWLGNWLGLLGSGSLGYWLGFSLCLVIGFGLLISLVG
jgi:hypothetical protein